MQTKPPAFDDLANLMTNAFGAAKGVGDEVRSAARARAERVIADMDLVSREEFDVLKAMESQSRQDIEALKAEVKNLQSQIKAMKSKSSRKASVKAKPRTSKSK